MDSRRRFDARSRGQLLRQWLDGAGHHAVWACDWISAVFLSQANICPKAFFDSVFFDANFAEAWPLETDLPAVDLYTGQDQPYGSIRQGMGDCTILRHGGPTATHSVPYKGGTPLPGAINMGFDDGHGELVKLQSLWTYSWHLNWNHP